MSHPRKGQYPGKLSRDAFRAHFEKSFVDPLFAPEGEAIARLEAIAWNAYCQGRKAPITRKAGAGFADPNYDLAVDWIAAHDAVVEAENRYKDPAAR